jgi:hypothetical protein
VEQAVSVVEQAGRDYRLTDVYGEAATKFLA